MDDVTAVHVAVRDCLSDLTPAGRVLVACSGGPDSLTLAAVTVTTARAHGFAAGAVVVDHGWSPAASAAGSAAAHECRSLGLDPVELVRVHASGPGGPEAAARDARYRALDEAAARRGAAAVLLGHTLDDQAETVLLGLGRGSGARSLAGMPARRGVFRRPFLGVRREVVARAGQALGLHPWHDPANDDPVYTRVRVRQLAPALEQALGPGVAQALARSAAMLREDADALDALAAELVAVVTVSGELEDVPGRADRADRAGLEGRAGLDGRAGLEDGVVAGEPGVRAVVGPLRDALPALRRRALLELARRAGCPSGGLGHRHALALERLVLTGRGRVDLPGGVLARVDRGPGPRLSLCRRIVAG
ncbi:tRNA lysidine(34) synthetase TilS [Kineosporia succinea]|uniref:tRNA(Ile)-lysidine synthase n=1 Tax=Kineosporia succinea TaxID=84632 RepID=A0ABT9P2W9_9ACTN|nr:tRNA lysidine(34) synthetase TilS [Kineosporia succinea]MDP9827035.1 tRNA(Ile)-lysidine synthase [Kineosporia succinea]